MLRHRDGDSAAWLERAADFAQYPFVFLDVLDHVERADHVELVVIRNFARIHLEQVRRWQAPRGEAQSFEEDLAAAGLQIRERPGYATQHVTRAAADFQHVLRVREIFAQYLHDQFVSGTKPEIFSFECRKLGKMFGAEARRFMGERRRIAR